MRAMLKVPYTKDEQGDSQKELLAVSLSFFRVQKLQFEETVVHLSIKLSQEPQDNA